MAGASILYVLLCIKGYRLFSNIAGGTIFTPANAALFRQIGLGALLAGIVLPCMSTVFGNAAHEKDDS